MKFPIALLAFNRPAYFERVLASLKSQRDIELNESDIFLFQDGAVNGISGKRYASDEDIAENVRLFQACFPGATVFQANSNLGVALNFERAERYVFEELQAPVAYFFEDDLELGPFYIKTLSRLTDIVLAREDIGYFAAYGDHNVFSKPQDVCNRLITLSHNWGFGLTRSQWSKSAPYIDQYLSIVREEDYRDRPAPKIISLFQSWGCGTPGTSQDVAKTLACYLSGSVKINTLATFARYIGEHGLHTNPAVFSKRNYEKTMVIEDDICLTPMIENADITTMRKELASYCSSNYFQPTVKKSVEKSPSQLNEKYDSAKVKPGVVSTYTSSGGGIRSIKLAMSEAEQTLFLSFLSHSRNYLEFGSGGSTVVASKLVDGHVWSVDSSQQWHDRVRQDSSFVSDRTTLHYVDIGPIGDWGWPVDNSKAEAFPSYSRDIWRLCKHETIDLFLIDGRFRVACFAEALKRASPNAFVFIHDYPVRPQYHIIESIARKIALVDTLALFQPNGTKFDLINEISEKYKLDPN